MLRIVEVGIGLALVFTLVALVCSVINEWISAMLEKRGNLLWEGIENLVGKVLHDDICKHQLMQGLVRKPTWFDKIIPWINRSKPSYVPTEMFVTTLLDALGARAAIGGSPPDIGQFPTTLTELQTVIHNAEDVPNDVKQALLALVNNAGSDIADDLAKAKKYIGDWFDAGMDRVTGWYKRWSQLILLVVSFIVALVLGVDSIAIAKRLWTDPVLREQVAEAAKKFVEENKGKPRVTGTGAPAAGAQPAGGTPMTSDLSLTSDLPLTSDSNLTTDTPLTSDVAPAESGTPAAGTPQAEEKKRLEDLAKQKLQEINVFQTQLEELSLPMSPLKGFKSEYEQSQGKKSCWLQMFGWWLWRHLLGFLLTSLAASLGAPFWFDVLNRFVNLRTTGKKPDAGAANPAPAPTSR